MATLLMPSSDHRQPQHSVLPHPHPHPHHPNRRVKKGKNAQKKPPQRGLGVAQLEKLRMQEECKKDLFFVAAAAAAAAQQQQQQQQPTPSAAQAPLLHFPTGGAFLDFECENAAAAVAMKQRRIQHSPGVVLEQHRPQLLFVPPPSSTSSLNSGSCKSGVSDASPQRSPAALGIASPSPSPRSPLAAAAAAAARESFSSLAPPVSKDAAAAAGVFLPSDHKRPRTPDSNLRDRAPPPLFDPSPFRQHQRRSHVDSREWLGVYHGVPEINKELSSFQIPGNTSQALSSASNRACDKKCPWPNASNNSSASNNNSPLDASKLMEWDLGTTTHYSGLAHCLNSSSSPCFSPSSSSWQESHHSMFALKDSCSSSLNNSDGSCAPAAKRCCRSSPSSSSQVDFLELKLSSSSPAALPLLLDDKFFGDSEKLVTAHQEASGETDDCSRLSCCNKLDLSLKVACYEESSSLDLRLAL